MSKKVIQNSKTKSQNTKYIYFVGAIILFIAVFLTFKPAMNNKLTNWDDDRYIHNNALITNSDSSSVLNQFKTFYLGNYHPLTMLSYKIEYKYFGLEARGYIRDNIILNSLLSVLVGWFLLLLFGSPIMAFVGAFLFGIHTLHVESVVWVSERKDLLYALFFVAALVSHMYYRKRNNDWKYLALTVLFFFLSLLSKGQAVTLPVVLILLDLYLKIKINTRWIIEKSLLLLVSVGFGIIAIFAQEEAIQNKVDYTFFDRIMIATHGLVFYLKSMILPINLSTFYPYPIKEGGMLPMLFYISLIVLPLIAFGIYFFYNKIKDKKALLGLLFFLVTIFPVLQLLPVGYAIMADRYAFIPSLGLMILLLASTEIVIEKLKQSKFIVFGILLIFVSSLLYFTSQRIKIWEDSISLWTSAIKQDPKNAKAYSMRASAFQEMGNMDSALSDYNHALKIDSTLHQALINRSEILSGKKDFTQAEKDYSYIINKSPKDVAGYNNRGSLYLDKKEYDKALTDFTQLVKIAPDNAFGWYNRGVCFVNLHQYDSAITDFRKSIKLNSTYANSYNNLGFALLQSNLLKEAELNLQKAISLGMKEPNAYFNLGNLYIKQNKFKEAEAQFSLAIAMNANYAEAYVFRAICKSALKMKKESISDLNKARELGFVVPESVNALVNSTK